MHIQLDAIGGVAGDMFVAALLDAFPHLEAPALAAVAAVARYGDAPRPRCRSLPHNDGVLQGRRFCVALEATGHPPDHDVWPHDHGGHDHHGGHGHGDGGHGGGELAHHDRGHRAWSAIRADLEAAPLDAETRRIAIAIFDGLARAEAAVHGITVEAVTFHEVGAWDSIADIVASAHLIAHCGATSWAIGPLPLGSGRVLTAHGPLPVPAPAAALLLRGFATIDDGVAGERVTPTGAAILRYLVEASPTPRRGRTLGRGGIGFGTRTLPGMSNCLRVLVYDEASAPGGDVGTPSAHRELAVIEFEVDDQSAEDLAMGLDRLRAHPDIFDVVQMPVFGKKGRMMTHVRALARAGAGTDAAIAACFRETTTIGLRHHRVDGAALPRRAETIDVEGRPIRVKLVERPGGARTAKAEADDAMSHETHADRAALRREAERLALSSANGS